MSFQELMASRHLVKKSTLHGISEIDEIKAKEEKDKATQRSSLSSVAG